MAVVEGGSHQTLVVEVVTQAYIKSGFINSFTADQTSIVAGNSITLSWSSLILLHVLHLEVGMDQKLQVAEVF